MTSLSRPVISPLMSLATATIATLNAAGIATATRQPTGTHWEAVAVDLATGERHEACGEDLDAVMVDLAARCGWDVWE